jgi:exopolyphosphatase/guanosine-5'-triphosphate,3'-diphosphate pyrophosphatase
MKLEFYSNHPRIAVIDIGSNTAKLLVAEKDRIWNVLTEESVTTRLGRKAFTEGCLGRKAISKTLETAQFFKHVAQEYQVDRWIAVATSAVREAGNRKSFEARFEKEMGFPIRVLSGNEEAELIYRGAVSDVTGVGPRDRLVVMDSGGGSAEWILGTKTRIIDRVSLGLGCVRMTELFLRGDPYSEKSYQKMQAWYHRKLLPLKKRFRIRNRLLIGTGGSITTAAALQWSMEDGAHVDIHNRKLSFSKLKGMLGDLRVMNQKTRRELRALPRKRADIIVAGIALFVAAMEVLEANDITISLRGLRYGILEQLDLKEP